MGWGIPSLVGATSEDVDETSFIFALAKLMNIDRVKRGCDESIIHFVLISNHFFFFFF